MSIISKLDFLAHFPMFGGLDEGSVLSAIEQAETEYDTSLPGWLQITLNLTAHILTMRSMGVAQMVDMMGTANGSSKFSMPGQSYHWKGTSLMLSPYGQEVSRLVSGAVAGGIFL